MTEKEGLNNLAFDGRRMEDSFFIQQDKALIDKQKTLKRMAQTKEALAAVSGIRNDSVLQKLAELEVRPETLAPLSVIPLVAVAWADGSISKNEEASVLAGVRALGINEESVGYGLLKLWLSQKPPKAMLEAWSQYVRGIGEKMTVQEKEKLMHEVLSKARKVAEASGGVLGVGTVSPEEKAVLEEMEKTFMR
ncbi:MAG: hypothetical protein JW699_03360 [Chitinispirillaceae bacterium]|nr:hypothetical protein [Chitinispirillaceae bacterium]